MIRQSYRTRMTIIASMLICAVCTITVAQIGRDGNRVMPMNEPHKKTLELGDGISIEVRGNHGDLVWFYRAGAKIAEDNVRDGDNLHVDGENFSWRKVSDDGNHYNVAVRHGRERDLVYGYAIIGTKVIRSPRWRDKTPGETPVKIEWSSSSIIGIDGRGFLEFIKQMKKWKAQAGPNAEIEGSQTELSQ